MLYSLHNFIIFYCKCIETRAVFMLNCAIFMPDQLYGISDLIKNDSIQTFFRYCIRFIFKLIFKLFKLKLC